MDPRLLGTLNLISRSLESIAGSLSRIAVAQELRAAAATGTTLPEEGYQHQGGNG
jgi:hypothetical protein